MLINHFFTFVHIPVKLFDTNLSTWITKLKLVQNYLNFPSIKINEITSVPSNLVNLINDDTHVKNEISCTLHKQKNYCSSLQFYLKSENTTSRSSPFFFSLVKSKQSTSLVLDRRRQIFNSSRFYPATRKKEEEDPTRSV